MWEILRDGHDLAIRWVGRENRALRRSPLLVVGRLALASATILAILSGCMFFDEVDRCLDRGGRWNDALGVCELQDPGVDEATTSEAPSARLRSG